ncbi:hypothetical protein [Clostridium sp.]|jgi:hypothetical protein|uniref:hypothetical protein n=1 Tax=Clostridium sp. TaxID=1506 RepID=UPI003EEE6001
MKKPVKIIKLFKELENGKESHLYATVSKDVEPIKKGDWVINTVSNTLGKIYSKKPISKFNRDTHRKIIATTDRKLTHPSTVQYGNMTMIDHNEDGSYYHAVDVEVEFSLSRKELIQRGVIIPQIQQLFLKEFVANPEGKYEVEYELIHNGSDESIIGAVWEENYKLKLNKDNTVNIIAVESCEHPYKKLHWVDEVVYCNKCNTTLEKKYKS